MNYTSTRDSALCTGASTAILTGIAPGGGLFVPQQFPQVDMREFYGLTYPQTAQKVLGMFLTDYDPDFLKTATEQTYSTENFGGKAGFAAHVAGNTYALELWHGPTCAFKDYALQLMPRLLVEAKKNLGETGVTKILVATSGDTGKAALAGYAGLPGIRIAVFYPNAGTSEVQRLQMATQEGDNVAVYAVNGNFDDAQTGVKRVFADEDLAQELAAKNEKLSSANSINWGRLVPQIVYYFYSYAQLAERGDIAPGAPVSFCVPTGNFGDILAGYYAKRMGLPVEKLICASNKNNVLTDFLTTGVYDARRTFYKTSSPSMDILVSSNLERLLYHVTQDGCVSWRSMGITPCPPKCFPPSGRPLPAAVPMTRRCGRRSARGMKRTDTCATRTRRWRSVWHGSRRPAKRLALYFPRQARTSSRAMCWARWGRMCRRMSLRPCACCRKRPGSRRLRALRACGKSPYASRRWWKRTASGLRRLLCREKWCNENGPCISHEPFLRTFFDEA